MEYDIGRELQRKRGDRRFRVYTFVCPEDFSYDTAAEAEREEKQELQRQHRVMILEGAVLYEPVPDPNALQKRVLAMREEALQLKVAQNRRAQATFLGVLLIALALAGIGYGVYRYLPSHVTEQIAHQLDPEAVATRLRQEIQARFETEAEAAIAYLESHKTDRLARADRAAAQVEAAQQTLQRELRPLMLQAGLHETRLEWEQALALMQTVSDKAPQWFAARNRLGLLLYTLARHAEAEPHQRAAVRLAQTPVEEAVALNNLVLLLQATNRLAEAEPLMRRALAIDEASYGNEHPKVAIRLNNLALLLKATNRLDEAEPLMRRALAIHEASYGSEHPRVAFQLNNLAQLLQATNRLDEAEPLMRRALEIDETSYGSEHPNVAIQLNNHAQLLKATDRLAEAEQLMRQTVEIFLLFTFRTGHQHPHLNTAVKRSAARRHIDPVFICPRPADSAKDSCR